MNIIRDYDLSEATFTRLSEIKGVVVIDEIDAHLHNKLQKDILPSLLQLFPKIQFILTTHSPIFLLGMEHTFTTDGYDILELPTGARISIEDFSEFDDLFSAISESQKHAELVKNKINESHLPVVFVEGDYDVKYLSKTIELFYDTELSSRFTLCDGDGFGNLDKIWRSLDTKATQALTSDMLLLYDCDTNKTDKDNGKSSKKVIPTVESNIIKKGIENLFSSETIAKLEKHSKCFIDVSPETTKTIRGVDIVVPATKEINKDEKRNICDWLIANGDESDFEGFKTVVEIIKQFLER